MDSLPFLYSSYFCMKLNAERLRTFFLLTEQVKKFIYVIYKFCGWKRIFYWFFMTWKTHLNFFFIFSPFFKGNFESTTKKAQSLPWSSFDNIKTLLTIFYHENFARDAIVKHIPLNNKFSSVHCHKNYTFLKSNEF